MRLKVRPYVASLQFFRLQSAVFGSDLRPKKGPEDRVVGEKRVEEEQLPFGHQWPLCGQFHVLILIYSPGLPFPQFPPFFVFFCKFLFIFFFFEATVGGPHFWRKVALLTANQLAIKAISWQMVQSKVRSLGEKKPKITKKLRSWGKKKSKPRLAKRIEYSEESQLQST